MSNGEVGGGKSSRFCTPGTEEYGFYLIKMATQWQAMTSHDSCGTTGSHRDDPINLLFG